jgi:hypothetical protein
MSNDFDPTRPKQSIDEQIPHSGVHGFEQPVNEFDNTPLSRAPIHHTLPEGVSTEHLPAYMLPENKTKANKRPFIIAGTALAGLGLGVGVYFGLGRTSAASGSNQLPAETSTSSIPFSGSSEQPSVAKTPTTVNPELYSGRVNPETLVNMSQAELTQLMQIKTNDAKTPDEFSRRVIQNLDTWANAGMTPNELSVASADNPRIYGDTVQKKYDEAFGKGLFGNNRDKTDQASAIAHNHDVFVADISLQISLVRLTIVLRLCLLNQLFYP